MQSGGCVPLRAAENHRVRRPLGKSGSRTLRVILLATLVLCLVPIAAVRPAAARINNLIPYNQFFEPYDDSVTEALDTAEYEASTQLRKKGRRETFAAKPPMELFGPLLSGAFDLGVSFATLLKTPLRKDQ